MLTRGPIRGAQQVDAQPVSDANGDPLPLIDIAASGSTAAVSVKLVDRASWALRSYIAAGQQASQVRQRDRVVLQVVNGAPTNGVATFGRPLPIRSW